MPDNEKAYVYILTENQGTEVSETESPPFNGFVSIDFAQGREGGL